MRLVGLTVHQRGCVTCLRAHSRGDRAGTWTPPLMLYFHPAGAPVSSPAPSFCLAEKIYIMKADTVIVGTVKTEVPEGRSLVGPAGPEFEEDLEVDHAPHYPEQETEPPLGSCRDVMFSVEEEGKEGPLPTTVCGK